MKPPVYFERAKVKKDNENYKYFFLTVKIYADKQGQVIRL